MGTQTKRNEAHTRTILAPNPQDHTRARARLVLGRTRALFTHRWLFFRLVLLDIKPGVCAYTYVSLGLLFICIRTKMLQAWAHILFTTKWYADTVERKTTTTRKAARFEPIGFDVVELDSSSMIPQVDRRWIGV